MITFKPEHQLLSVLVAVSSSIYANFVLADPQIIRHFHHMPGPTGSEKPRLDRTVRASLLNIQLTNFFEDSGNKSLTKPNATPRPGATQPGTIPWNTCGIV